MYVRPREIEKRNINWNQPATQTLLVVVPAAHLAE